MSVMTWYKGQCILDLHGRGRGSENPRNFVSYNWMVPEHYSQYGKKSCNNFFSTYNITPVKTYNILQNLVLSLSYIQFDTKTNR